MLLSELRTHVRDTIGFTSTDAATSDTYLDLVFREGTYDIVSRARRWPSYEASWTIAATSGTQTYVIATVEPASTDTAEIISIVDSTSGGYRLDYIDHDVAEDYWRNTFNVSGVPQHWSVWGGSIYLWPKPNANRTLNVRSYRKVNDWVADGASGTPDMDTRLQPALVMYALYRVYAQQEEVEQAKFWRDAYERHVGSAMAEIFRPTQFRQLIMNGGFTNPTFDSWLRSLGRNTPW